jgi:hypothetical protein
VEAWNQHHFAGWILEKQLDGKSVILVSSPYKDGGDRLVKQVKGGMEECDEVKGICSLVSLIINN